MGPALQPTQPAPWRQGTRGRFQPVEGRVAPGSERGTAGLTPKGLDRLGTPMLAIPDQRVELRIGVAKVLALRVRTGEAFSVDSFGRSSPTFDLLPGSHRSTCWFPRR